MRRTKVLIVEDDLSWLKIFHLLVGDSTQEMFEYIHVDSLQSAISILKSQEVGLVLLDLMLPDSHAKDTINAMGVHAHRVPIVIMTTLDDENLMSDAFKSGMEDYLIKDQYDLETFIHVTRQSIRRFIGHASGSFKKNIDETIKRLQSLDDKLQTMQESF